MKTCVNVSKFLMFILVIAICLIAPIKVIAEVVFYTDFNSGVPAEFTGITTTENVQGFNSKGTGSNVFSGDFLRNATGSPFGNPGSPTILTLTNLPVHDNISLNFLLAIINSWDGSAGIELGGPDYFNVKIDGNLIFSETFSTFEPFYPKQSYNPPPGGFLTTYDGEVYPEVHSNIFVVPGDEGWNDSGYNMGLESRFQNIPHTSSTLVVEWFANGGGWQGRWDESWAIDNVEVVTTRTVNEVPVKIDIKPGSWPNSINLRANGVIPVAILTDGSFDATTVDPLTVEFGPNGAIEFHKKGHIEDVDGDGDLDMVLHFEILKTGIEAGDTEACLVGETVDSKIIKGCDVIVTVSSKGKP